MNVPQYTHVRQSAYSCCELLSEFVALYKQPGHMGARHLQPADGLYIVPMYAKLRSPNELRVRTAET